jgi:hypothetical protein
VSFGYYPAAWSIGAEYGLSTSEQAILLALAEFADENGTCYPGQQLLASMVHCTPRTVATALAELEALNLIERQRRTNGLGHRTSDEISLRFLPATVSPGRLPTGNSRHPYRKILRRNLSGNQSGQRSKERSVARDVQLAREKSKSARHARSRKRDGEAER